MGYPNIGAILDSGLTLRFSVRGHRYVISPLWDDDYREDPFGGSQVAGYCFEDLDGNTSFFSRGLNTWKKLLDIPLEGGLTLRNDYAEVVFDPLYLPEEED